MSGGDALALIGHIRTESAKVDGETGTWVTNEKGKLIKQGLAYNSIVCFDEFRKQFERLNDMYRATGHHDHEATVATIYADVVRELGDLVATKLDLQLDTSNSVGKLKPTVQIIREMLGKTPSPKPLLLAARAVEEPLVVSTVSNIFRIQRHYLTPSAPPLSAPPPTGTPN